MSSLTEGEKVRFALQNSVPLFPKVVGILKGYDQLVNLVLDDCVEYLRGMRHLVSWFFGCVFLLSFQLCCVFVFVEQATPSSFAMNFHLRISFF